MSGRSSTGLGVGCRLGLGNGVSTFQHMHISQPGPHDTGVSGVGGWDEGLGTQLKWELEAREGLGGRLECTAAGSAGVQGWRGPRGRLLPAACPRGVMRGNRERGGGGRRRGPRAGVSSARWTKR